MKKNFRKFAEMVIALERMRKLAQSASEAREKAAEATTAVEATDVVVETGEEKESE